MANERTVRLLTSSEVELMETIKNHIGDVAKERLLTSSEVELMETFALKCLALVLKQHF